MKNKPISDDKKDSAVNTDLKQPNTTASKPESPAPDKTCTAKPDDSTNELQKLQEEIESLRKAAAERNEFLNLLQRVQADFLNYQKRVKKEKECWDKYQDEGILHEILPVLANFGRTLKIQCTTEESRCIMDGVEIIKREIFRILEKRGVKQIKTVGEKFDTNIHEAVAVLESAEHKDNEIIEEISAGFMLHDRLIRAAKVRIAKKPKQEEKKEETK